MSWQERGDDDGLRGDALALGHDRGQKVPTKLRVHVCDVGAFRWPLWHISMLRGAELDPSSLLLANHS